MTRLIDADEIRWEDHYDSDGNMSKYKVAYSDEMPPAIDAIPVSFIQELIERDKQLIDEYGGKPDFEVIVDGLIDRAVNYEAMIEKWREKNGTETD